MSAFLAITFYLAMVAAALIVEAVFHWFGSIPYGRYIVITDATIALNYTAALNIIFGVVFAIPTIVFLKTGDPEMMRMTGVRVPIQQGVGGKARL